MPTSESLRGVDIAPAEEQRERWHNIVQILDFAFQPIVNIHTGVAYGCEALLRHYQEAGFASIQDVFNTAYHERMLFYLDSLLREKALLKFRTIPFHHRLKIFYNIDNRMMLMPDYSRHSIAMSMRKLNFDQASFCFEISEKHDFQEFILHDFKSLNEIKNILNLFKKDLYKIAIDDFGSGLSGFQMLYHSEPDFIKIDRFFINGIEEDSRKTLFVSSILKMAHILGIIVIAEGVETDAEFYACKRIGCNYIQGYLVQRPTTFVNELCEKYEKVSVLNRKDRRDTGSDQDMIFGQLEFIEPIKLYHADGRLTDMGDVFDSFRRNKGNSFFPLINGNDEPIGVIREKDLKDYVYSPYGKDLLRNKAAGNIVNFISKIPVSEINTRVEKILEIFSTNVSSEGILLTENGLYRGFLSASSLLKLLNEKNIAEARDQNPLTRLPGNNIVQLYISESLENTATDFTFVYFDFDNFKPFNDKYGFRQGDRAILIFADILKEITNQANFFIGHIGGDDFFAAFRDTGHRREEIDALIHKIINRFRNDVMSIYTAGDRNRGYIVAYDREGVERKYPLLSVSAGVLNICGGARSCGMEEVFSALADLKKQAKRSGRNFQNRTLGNDSSEVMAILPDVRFV